MMALLFLWTVVLFFWYEWAGYEFAIHRNHWHFNAWRAAAILWLIYGTMAVTFILWEYLP